VAVATTSASSRGEVQLLETREVQRRLRLLRWAAPAVSRSVQPGQFVHVRSPAPRGLLLPAVAVAGFDRVHGSFSMLLHEDHPASAELWPLRAGDTASIEGPLGRGFEIDARSRFLLVVADAAGFARVRAVVDEAVASGRQVALLLGAGSAAEVPPSSLLPDEAEYVVATEDGSIGHAGSVADLIIEYEAWADQCFAAAEDSILDRVAALATGRDERMGVARLGRRRGRRGDPETASARRRAWLQVALPHEAGCVLGICLGCVATGRRGPLRVCREGPAFGSGELLWDPVS